MARKNTRRPNILIVDDDPTVLDLSARALLKSDYQITTSLRMEDALIGFEKNQYDLVITDIFMPGLGGIEGIRKLRETWPDVKILAMSAGFSEMTSEPALEAATKIGANKVLPKPFSLEDLRNTVAQLLAED